MTRAAFTSVRSLVVKVGSALLQEGPAAFQRIADDVASLHRRGVRTTIVSSGAVALGRPKLGLPGGGLTLEQKQAAAAAGQTLLVDAWARAFEPHGLHTAQTLITLDVTEVRRRWLNARSTLNTLLDLGAIPVVNENDTVATEEIRYGDNDRLAARVAQLVGADLLVLLSDIDGLYTADPREDPEARKLTDIPEITDDTLAMAGEGNTEAGVGTGGMITKLAAAQIAAQSGCATAITHGAHDTPLLKLADASHGSWFSAPSAMRIGRTSWLAGAIDPQGEVRVDAGAGKAVQDGKSLLPVGVIGVSGQFERGDAVLIVSEQGQVIGRGISAYDADDARLIGGQKTDRIEEILGYKRAAALVHADDILLS